MSGPIKVLVGVLLGLVVGVACHQFWTPSAWQGVGVGDAKAFMTGVASEANNSAGVLAEIVRTVIRVNTFLGDAFVRALRLIAVPLVLFSLVAGVASLGRAGESGQPDTGSGKGSGGAAGLRALGRIGGRTLAVFAVTTVIAIIIGLVLANVLAPGKFVSEQTRLNLAEANATAVGERVAQAELSRGNASVWQILLNAIPTNPFDALARGDMLQVIVLAVLMGAALLVLISRQADGARSPANADGAGSTALVPIPALTIARGCEALGELFITIGGWVLRLAPIGVFCLMARTSADLGPEVVRGLAALCGVVVLGLTMQMVFVYGPMAIGLGRLSIRQATLGMLPAQAVAFSSSSSAATLPVTIRCVRENLGVRERVASFVCPLGATVNMDGTALYQAVCAIFIAQVYGIELSIGQQMLIVLMTTLSSVGAPGIPGGGIVMFITVMQAVGLPMEGLAMILAVDRVLDMCRTVVNVTGDGVVAAVIDRWEPGARQ
jgi:proton glutamate symport protein